MVELLQLAFGDFWLGVRVYRVRGVRGVLGVRVVWGVPDVRGGYGGLRGVRGGTGGYGGVRGGYGGVRGMGCTRSVAAWGCLFLEISRPGCVYGYDGYSVYRGRVFRVEDVHSVPVFGAELGVTKLCILASG